MKSEIMPVYIVYWSFWFLEAISESDDSSFQR